MVDGEIVKFDKVWTNNRNCYNPTTEVFTAPKTGLCQVSATVMSSSSKALHFHLWQNKNPLVSLYAAVGYNEATTKHSVEFEEEWQVILES